MQLDGRVALVTSAASGIGKGSAASYVTVALFLAAFPSNALTGQSLIVSHGWHRE